MSLAPCSSCSRHVRVSEADCPFCDARVEAGPAASPRPLMGLSRAMMFFGGAVALSTAIEACGGEPLPVPVPVYGAPAAVDAGEVAPPGTPAPSAIPAPSAAPTGATAPAPTSTGASSVAAAPASSGKSVDPLSAAANAPGIGSPHSLAGQSGYGGPPAYNRAGLAGTDPPKAEPKPKK